MGFYLAVDLSRVLKVTIIWKQTGNLTGLRNQITEFRAAKAAIK